MTEAEWQTSVDPDKMLWLISGHPDADKLWRNGYRPSERKWKLLGVGCCRRIWPRITEVECRRVVEVVEAFVDGRATEVEVQAVANSAVDCGYKVHYDPCLHRAYAATDALGRGVGMDATLEHSCSVAVGHAAWAVGNERVNEMMVQSRLTRCVFGNPFRPAIVDPSWLTSDVRILAEGIYADRAFDRMPILADALQDAGCDNEDILNHCRSDGPHVRGCWVVDLLTGRK